MRKKLIEGNEQFLSTFENKELLKELANGQHPSAAVICCSDSRVIPEIIFSKTFGDLFVIRTAGNVINEGELASVEYAIHHLHVSLVVVLGHTHCGAVHAAIKKEKGLYLDPVLNRIQRNISSETDERKASELNALKEVLFIKDKFPTFDGEVSAMIYDIETGKVEAL